MSDVECVHDIRMLLGECPRWHPLENMLYWTDIDNCELLRSDGAGAPPERAPLPGKCGCFAFLPRGELLLAVGTEIMLWEEFGSSRAPEVVACLPSADIVPGLRFNDGCADPAGRFVLGTVDPSRTDGKACVYSFDLRSGSLAKLLDGLLTFNGLAFATGADQAWFADTPRHELYRASYDVHTGKLGKPRLLRKFDMSGGRPDGACFDTAGHYWCAMYAGGKVARLSPHGDTVAEIAIPAKHVTMCSFGGSRMNKLFVTSARREGDPADEDPASLSGGVFCADAMNARGIPVNFAVRS